MPDNNTSYIPTQQPQHATSVTPEMLRAMREYSQSLQTQQQKPPFYTWANGLADMSAKIMAGLEARKADILERQQLHQGASDAVKHLPGPDPVDPWANAQPASYPNFNPFGMFSNNPPSVTTEG